MKRQRLQNCPTSFWKRRKLETFLKKEAFSKTRKHQNKGRAFGTMETNIPCKKTDSAGTAREIT
jgi:hypothetical protein